MPQRVPTFRWAPVAYRLLGAESVSTRHDSGPAAERRGGHHESSHLQMGARLALGRVASPCLGPFSLTFATPAR